MDGGDLPNWFTSMGLASQENTDRGARMCARVWDRSGFALCVGAVGQSFGLTEGGSRSPDKKINKINKMGRATATGGAPASASNPPIIFLVFRMCFTECFTRRLTFGVAPRGRRAPEGAPKRKPRWQRIPTGLSGGWQVGGVLWVYPCGTYNSIVLSVLPSVNSSVKYIFFRKIHVDVDKNCYYLP